MTFNLMFVNIIFVTSVWFADWPPFGKELLYRLTICFISILTNIFRYFSYFPPGSHRWQAIAINTALSRPQYPFMWQPAIFRSRPMISILGKLELSEDLTIVPQCRYQRTKIYSVTLLQTCGKMTLFNPNINLVNENVYTKFD